MILYIFINCHYNQLLKKFEYYPPINLILFTQKELWVLSETVFFYCVKRLYRHASSSFDVVLGRQKEVLFFSVCVRACQHRPFTLEPKQKRERKVVKKRATTSRPPGSSCHVAKALDASYHYLDAGASPTLLTTVDGVIPATDAWTGAGYSSRSMWNEKERERQLLLLLPFIRAEKKTRQGFVSTYPVDISITLTGTWPLVFLYSKHNGIQSFFFPFFLFSRKKFSKSPSHASS